MAKVIGKRSRKKINMLQCYDEKRWNMWWTNGKKDGMCGHGMDLYAVPKVYREAYEFGWVYGAECREVA